MKIFHLNNVRLMDEKGEIWGSTGGRLSEGESDIYIESNYFHKPKELYILFDGIHALNKDDTTLLIDEKNGQLIKYPKDGIIQSAKLEGEDIVIQLNTPRDNDSLSFDSVTDGAGKDINGHKQSYWSSEGINRKEVRVEYQPEKVTKGPLKLKIGNYPLTHKQQVKLRIK